MIIKKTQVNIIVLTLLLLALINVANAQEQVPENMQKIIDYNKQVANDSLTNITILVAVIAGILTFISPCILPLLPAYFSYTFKEEKNIAKMTLFFSAGFTLVFTIYGIIAGYVGERSISIIQNPLVAAAGGAFLVLMGILSLQGKGFASLIKINSTKRKNDSWGVFLQGVAFSTGWTACVGPILGGILAIGALLGKIEVAAILMIAYSMGIFIPLFILSLAYDKYHLEKKLKGKPITINLFGRKKTFLSTHLISGSLLILLGLFYIIFGNTAKVNGTSFFGLKQYFYTSQRWLLSNEKFAVLFFIIIIIITIMLLRKKEK